MTKELVSWCLDQRMKFELLAELCQKHGIEWYHPAPAGGCSLLLEQQYEHIQVIVDLKNPTRANLFDHLNCLAFTNEFGEMTHEEQIKKHEEVMHQAAAKLQRRFPSIKEIRLYLLVDVEPERIGTKVIEFPYEAAIAA